MRDASTLRLKWNEFRLPSGGSIIQVWGQALCGTEVERIGSRPSLVNSIGLKAGPCFFRESGSLFSAPSSYPTSTNP